VEDCRPSLEDLEHLEGVGQALHRVGLGDRATFRLVGVEQRRSCAPAPDRGDLPDEVVRVLDAGVHAESARGREAVSGVSHQEDASGTVAPPSVIVHGLRSRIVKATPSLPIA
jgi:hypothetical protein